MVDLILLIGTSGSGKTTWAKVFCKKHENAIRISADDLRIKLTGNIDDKSKDYEVHKLAVKRVFDCLKNGKIPVFDSTNLNKFKRRTFLSAIRSKYPNINIQYVLMHLDPEEAKKRIKFDLEKGIHRANVSEETIDRHAESYAQMLIDIQDEGIYEFNRKVFVKS
jgi:predicted kinase